MADKLVALLGPGKGPRLFTGRMKNLVLCVRNLSTGEVVITADREAWKIELDGEYPIPDSEWLEFSHEGKSKHLICTIQSKANALHRAGPDSCNGDSERTGSAA